MKCDFCGRIETKMKTRRNFPHGKKSKGITTKTCKSCNRVQEQGEGGSE